MSKKFTISVIIPIYNVEKYLTETIDSVINQTIGFEDNIELILVNDGSPDDSESICLDYLAKYPNNILYIKQENSGVSAARNTGLNKASGRYVAFLDSDDKLDGAYFEHMVAILKRNPKIPFSSARVKLFDAQSGYHISDYKFDSTRVVDLEDDPSFSTSLATTLVYRANAVRDVRFDTKMTHNEDAKFIDTVLLKSGIYKYAVVRDAVYLYRKREGESSATDTAKERRSFYDSTILYAKFLADAGKFTKDGKIPKFIQFHALYHYRWRISQNKKPDILTNEEWRIYKNVVLNGIRSLDEEIILAGSVNLNIRHKISLLYVKFNNEKRRVREALKRHKELSGEIWNQIRFTVNTINYVKSKAIVVEGSTPFCEPDLFDASMRFFLDDKELSVESFEVSAPMFDENLKNSSGFRIVIPADRKGILRALLVNREAGKERQLDMAYESTARISMRQSDYRILKGKILLLPSINSLTITDFKLRKIATREIRFFLQNILKNKYNVEKNVPKTLAVEIVRIVALISIRRKPSRVWLFSDRSISGGDNSEVLFRYVSDQKDSTVKPFFAINKNAPAYKKLKKGGYKVIPFKSIRHLYLAIVSEMILPSHMDMMYLYPWFGVWQKYCGLIQYDIAHTQHGIVLNDISNYISKNKKNASIFLSACVWEQGHLTEGSYRYTKEQVPVTGLPRYDELKDTSADKRIIALHPTWRSWLAGREKDGVRAYSNTFKESEYFLFYNRLLNDSRIIDVLERNDYIIRYYIHPNHNQNRGDFLVESDRVELMEFPYDYSKLFSESKLFITDYSNTLFDFAYLRKPVIHMQFDADTFFSKQGAISEQLFDYKKEGFGPVCDDYESAVSVLISAIDGGIVLEDKYRKRIDRFFTYDDNHNSERAYRVIKSYYLENNR